MALLALAAVAACGGGASEEDLAQQVQPLVDAHAELEDFERKIGAGLTYGDILDEWPDVSTRVQRLLDDYDEEAQDEANSCDADAFLFAIAIAHDGWAEVHQAVGGYIRDDEPETEIADAYRTASDVYMDSLQRMEADALEVGDQCGDEEE